MWSNIEAAGICNDFVVIKEDTAIHHLLHCITIAFFLKFLSESNLLSLDLWNGRGENVSYKLVFSKNLSFLVSFCAFSGAGWLSTEMLMSLIAPLVSCRYQFGS